MNDKQQIVVRSYRGNEASATAMFRADAAAMGVHGYVPTTQAWVPGSYGCGPFLLATLLVLVFGIGLLVFAYLLIVKPKGTLTATFELRGNPSVTAAAPAAPVVSAPPAARAAGASEADRAKWSALVQYDKDIEAAAVQVRPFGQKWEDELASAYLALNDKQYLPQIVESICARAKAEQ